MSRGENQKKKLLRLLEIFMDLTDENHGLTVNEIISHLKALGINAERKSIYDDFLALDEIGFSIDKMPTRPPRYTLVDRVFELAELKLLVDAVQSSKFITVENTREIIEKLKRFAGIHNSNLLSRQVYVEGRAKTVNKATIYTIDTIHTAINENKQISFKYFSYNSKKERVLRHGGNPYYVSPTALIWNNENYYLVAYDSESHTQRNYRVDKILDIKIEKEKRSREATAVFNSADYTQKIFGMYGGKEELVTLECDESLAGVIIDRFGTELTFSKTDNGFRFSARVILSPIFYAWVMGFGSKIRIVSPSSVREEFLKELRATLNNYEVE